MKKMKEIIFNNIFPVSGGTAGALLSTTVGDVPSILAQLPSKEAVIATIILGLIGAFTGYVAGKLCAWVHKCIIRLRKGKGEIEYR